MRDRVEEQLTDAYSRSVVLSQSELTIRPSVQGEPMAVDATEDASSHLFQCAIQ